MESFRTDTGALPPARPSDHSLPGGSPQWPWVTFKKSRVREIRMLGSVRAKAEWLSYSTIPEGEWAAVKYGGRGKRAWKKLHLGVDRSGVIVAEVLTDGNADDAKTALNLIDEVEGDIASFTADAAYDTIAIYDAAAARGAKVVVPPMKTATRSRRRRPRSTTLDRSIKRVRTIGRRQW